MSIFETRTTTKIEHYGVKGMKWGVRRSRSERAKARKKASDLSDKELASSLKRLRMEREYERLINGPQSQLVSQVKGQVTSMVVAAGVGGAIGFVKRKVTGR